MAKKIKTISTIAAITTSTLIVAPISRGIQNKVLLVNNNSKNKMVTEMAQSKDNSQNNIYNNTVKVENVWGESLFSIGFNANNTFKITKGTGVINPKSHEKLTITISNMARKVLKNIQLEGGTSPENEVYKALNGFEFNIGDTIKISSGTGSEYFINNAEKQQGSVTYKITQQGLVQITAKATEAKAIYKGNEEVDFSCKVKPNTLVDLICNGKFFVGISNSQGVVNTTINGKIGDVVSIYPVGELETQVKIDGVSSNSTKDNNKANTDQKNISKSSTKKVQAGSTNKVSTVLSKQSIIVNNVWNQHMFSIGFTKHNKLVVQGGWAETNPYYTGSNSLTVQLLNDKGEQIYGQVFRGGVTPTEAISTLLNGKAFEYGDLIHIQSNSNANIKLSNQTYKGNIYFQINQNGLTYLQSNNNTYNAKYDGKNTIVNGIVKANEKISIIANGKKYSTMANSQGKFNIKLPSTVIAGEDIQIINSQGVTQNVKVNFNKADFAILNSALKVTNAWGTNAININFNPETMKINTSGWNQFLGQNSQSPFMQFSLYNGKTGNPIKSVMLKGADSTSSLTNAINNLGFNFGDIVAVSYNNSQGSIGIYNGQNSIGNTTGSLEYFKITQNGLVKYENPTTIDPLNILTQNEIRTLNIKGKTLPNTNVQINVDGENFVGSSNANGNFNIKVSSQIPFSTTTAINVKVKGEIAQTVYPSAANMLESNSGIYLSGNAGWFGKIVFNPVTMKIRWFAPGASISSVNDNPTTYNPNAIPTNLNQIINSDANYEVLGIVIKSKNGQVILNKSFNGTDTLQDIYNAINNLNFAYGDTVSIYQNHGSIEANVMSNGKVITPESQNTSFEITPNGLVNAIKGQSVYNNGFTVSNYYAKNGVVATGLTASGWDNGSEELANNMVMDQAMKDRVNQAIKGDSTDLEKAQAIFNIVSPVPYENVGGNTINTYEHGGVCFNKAQLYAVMGQYAGLVTRVVTGYVNEPGDYQRYSGFHSWNQVWIPSENRWMTVDTTWHMFNCNQYVDNSRHSFSVQATLWNPAHSYTSYFANDPAKAWEHTAQVWNHALYYNFNLGNDPQFRNLFKGITPSSINIYNTWGTNAASITFDGENNTFNVQGSNNFLGGNTSENFMTIGLVNPKTGATIFNKTLKGNNSVTDLANALANKHYKLGDILEISYANNQNSHINVIADGKTISNGQGAMQMFKITSKGLVPFRFDKKIKIKATATTGLKNEAFYQTTISGTALANKDVIISVNGQNFVAKTNENGQFTKTITTNDPMTNKTKIIASQWGENSATVTPILTKKVELEDSQIIINNVWNDNLGVIGFNTHNMKLTEAKGWYMTNPYLSSSAEAFSIGLNDSNGKNLASLTAMGSDPIPTPLYNEFDEKGFAYGDSITINYKTSANIILDNVYVEGKLVNNYKVTKPMTLYITKGGLTTQKPII
ncbi:MAG: transglutaminase domain-containing protein [Sarcina sp.]